MENNTKIFLGILLIALLFGGAFYMLFDLTLWGDWVPNLHISRNVCERFDLAGSKEDMKFKDIIIYVPK